MKRIMVLILVFAGTILSCEGDIAPREVPSVIVNTFTAGFPGATDVEWEKKNDRYEVDFEWKNTDYTAALDGDGNVIRYKHDLELSQFPEAVKHHLSETYPKKQIDDAEAVIIKGQTYYQAELDGFLKDKKMVFDANGLETTAVDYWN